MKNKRLDKMEHMILDEHICPFCGSNIINASGHYYCPKHGCIYGDCFSNDGINYQLMSVTELETKGELV